MAYDPEARENSNTAMVIGIVAVVLIVLGALAWYATRPTDEPTVVTQPPTERVIERETVEQPVMVPDDTPNTVIVEQAPGTQPSPPTSSSTTTRTEVDITTSPSGDSGTSPTTGGSTASNETTNAPATTPTPAGNTTDGY